MLNAFTPLPHHSLQPSTIPPTILLDNDGVTVAYRLVSLRHFADVVADFFFPVINFLFFIVNFKQVKRHIKKQAKTVD